MKPEFYSAAELMKLLRFKDRKAFWQFVHNTAVPHVRLNARHIIFPSVAVDAWIAKRFSGAPHELAREPRPAARAPRLQNPNGLLNATQLARELGVSTWIIYASKRAGEHFGDTAWLGRYTTVQRFYAWLEKHPVFVAAHWVKASHRPPQSGKPGA
jgi:predicted DNA-binding transcriptional regulator AlpA